MKTLSEDMPKKITHLEEPLLPVGERGPLLALVLELGPREVVAAVVLPDLLPHPGRDDDLHLLLDGAAVDPPLPDLYADDAVRPLAGLQSVEREKIGRLKLRIV